MAQKESSARTAIVVEGDANARSLVTALLEESDFEIVECQSGEAALATMRMRGRGVALMFADQCLAGHMDGVDLAREVKKRWPELTIVLSSEQPDRCMESLPDGIFVLGKPWIALQVLMIAERARAAGSGRPH